MRDICASCGQATVADPHLCGNAQRLKPGTLVDGRYLIEGILGAGGMSVVYLARHRTLQRQVALKVLRCDLLDDHVSVRRFVTEAQSVARLQSPHSVAVFDAALVPDQVCYIAMERLKGRTLGQAMAEAGGKLNMTRALHIADQLLEGLEEAHGAGILHRDIKPENIFLADDRSEPDFVVLVDFGLVRVVHGSPAEITQLGAAAGSPMYMSPEHIDCRPQDARTDLYSLGVVLFEMLAGEPPFRGDNAFAVLLQKLRAPQPRVSEIAPDVRLPGALEELIASLIEPSADRRPADARSVRALLQTIAGESPRSLLARSVGLTPRPTAHDAEVPSKPSHPPSKGSSPRVAAARARPDERPRLDTTPIRDAHRTLHPPPGFEPVNEAPGQRGASARTHARIDVAVSSGAAEALQRELRHAAERRAHPRERCTIRVQWTQRDDSGYGTVVNVSAVGALLISPEPPGATDLVTICPVEDLVIPRLGLVGEVVRTATAGDAPGQSKGVALRWVKAWAAGQDLSIDACVAEFLQSGDI